MQYITDRSIKKLLSKELLGTKQQKDYEAFLNMGSSGQVPAMYHLPAKFATFAAGNPGRY